MLSFRGKIIPPVLFFFFYQYDLLSHHLNTQTKDDLHFYFSILTQIYCTFHISQNTFHSILMHYCWPFHTSFYNPNCIRDHLNTQTKYDFHFPLISNPKFNIPFTYGKIHFTVFWCITVDLFMNLLIILTAFTTIWIVKQNMIITSLWVHEP